MELWRTMSLLSIIKRKRHERFSIFSEVLLRIRWNHLIPLHDLLATPVISDSCVIRLMDQIKTKIKKTLLFTRNIPPEHPQPITVCAIFSPFLSIWSCVQSLRRVCWLVSTACDSSKPASHQIWRRYCHYLCNICLCARFLNLHGWFLSATHWRFCFFELN